MLLFFVYLVLFAFCIYKCNFFRGKHFVLAALALKAIFVLLITYTHIGQNSAFNTADEDNYFHDVCLFHQLARQHPGYYLQFLFDIEPSDEKIYNQYFSQTNAWYKAPEFFYNDNRWVIKIHSILSFASGCALGVHRLFSVMFSIIGWTLILNVVIKVFSRKNKVYSDAFYGWLFFVSSLFPSFFFFNNFILKESIMILFAGLLMSLVYQWIVEKKYSWINIVTGSVLILISCIFRPMYLIPLMSLTSFFLIIDRYVTTHKVIFFIAILFASFILKYGIIEIVFHKNIFGIIQYRQERFLDASRGGIFLVNEKKFVRVPYDWNNLKIDSTNAEEQKIYIKKDVPLMYWYISNLNDTIIENNRDTADSYRILYYIQRANRTVYVQPINVHKSLLYNIKSILQAVNVFFFYPRDIKNIMDVVVWFENILIVILLVMVVGNFKAYPLYHTYILVLILY
ncbi:MAG: hypothetical protein D6799_03970, partial [Bacteroidetes bacterium]